MKDVPLHWWKYYSHLEIASPVVDWYPIRRNDVIRYQVSLVVTGTLFVETASEGTRSVRR